MEDIHMSNTFAEIAQNIIPCMPHPPTLGIGVTYIGFIVILAYLPISYIRLRKLIKSPGFQPPTLYEAIRVRLKRLAFLYGFLCFTGGWHVINWYQAFECGQGNGDIAVYGYTTLAIFITISVLSVLFLRSYFKRERANHIKSIRVYAAGAATLAFMVLIPPVGIEKVLENISLPDQVKLKTVDFGVQSQQPIDNDSSGEYNSNN